MKMQYFAEESDGRFLAWFVDGLNKNGMTCIDLASRLGISSQTVSNIVTKRTKPTKVTIIAMCWAFGVQDNPEDIWKLVKEEWS